MAKYSFYAIEAGGQKHIFRTWAECQAFRDKYPSNARYKGFASEADASAFLNASDTTPSSPAPVSSHIGVQADPGTAIAYTDGSYNPATTEWGYGVILFPSMDEQQKHEYYGKGIWCSDTRNVAGEVQGAVRAVKEAINLGFQKLIIFHDYEGVEAWATGRWAAKKEISRWYRHTLESCSHAIEVQFRKVDGHTGVLYNEAVDVLAKRALGIQ